jgi:hypothetical protein
MLVVRQPFKFLAVVKIYLYNPISPTQFSHFFDIPAHSRKTAIQPVGAVYSSLVFGYLGAVIFGLSSINDTSVVCSVVCCCLLHSWWGVG